MKTFVGIDNGVTGSVGIIYPSGEYTYFPTPIKSELSYTRVKQNISRIDVLKFKELLQERLNLPALIVLERPMVNPGRFKQTISAIRALEATLIVLEALELPYMYIDSRAWQKVLLPSGLKGAELKTASLDVGKRLFPTVHFKADADSLLIAEYAKRKNL